MRANPIHERRSGGIGLPPELAGLDDLALDLRLVWSHRADDIWRRINPELWAASQNPYAVLKSAGWVELGNLARDAAFAADVQSLVAYRRERLEPANVTVPDDRGVPLPRVGYFSMEFGLSESLPIYAGGLGILAGDHLKSASDLGVPVTGVGLLYQQGYFRQVLDHEGHQHELYPSNDPSEMPLNRVRDEGGDWVRIALSFPGRTIYVRTWLVNVGRSALYLLDSNDPANSPSDRGITARLYDADPEVRWQQELVLGVAGWRLLARLRIAPEVCHLNEGHAALAVLERARELVVNDGVSFDVALAVARAGTVFTTHTPVAAAFDRFDAGVVARYLGTFVADCRVGLNVLLDLGREHAGASDEPFNMTYLAVRGSSHVNGVSRLHGEVSRTLFEPLFPRWPVADIPIGHVTNGVHVPTWSSTTADEVWTTASGIARDTFGAADFAAVPFADEELWSMRARGRARLVTWVRERLARQLSAAGAGADAVDAAAHVLDPGILTLGLARRFTAYKRPTELLHDPERMARFITDPKRPIQIVVAGKSHPRDDEGKAFIQAWCAFAARPDVRSRVVFLADYDLVVAEQLVGGVDVWINTPRRPWEASGTSGMKVLVNGGLNVSELDGWWAEAYRPDVGWAIGDGRQHDDDPHWDAAEAEQLYGILDELVPMFYVQKDDGSANPWIARIRASMQTLTPQFSTNRMVREYVQQCYVPAARALRERRADRYALADDLVRWQQAIANGWDAVSFGHLTVGEAAGEHRFRVLVSLGAIAPDAVHVELYAAGSDGGPPTIVPMQRLEEVLRGTSAYEASVPATRPASDYTPRIVPWHPHARIPLELHAVRWQR